MVSIDWPVSRPPGPWVGEDPLDEPSRIPAPRAPAQENHHMGIMPPPRAPSIALLNPQAAVRIMSVQPKAPPGYQPAPRLSPHDALAALVRDLKRLERENRDPYPGEWFRLARRFVRARRAIYAGAWPPPRPPRGGTAVRRPPPADED